jgi:hypothetical protein
MIPRNTSLGVHVLCGLMAILSAAGLEAAQQPATAQASTGFVDVDGGKLYYEESNHGGQTVVLTHDGVVDSAVWNGADDIPEVQAHAGAIEAGIPGARRIVMDGVGHLLYLEKPAEFARLAINFLEANQVAQTRQEIQNRGD